MTRTIPVLQSIGALFLSVVAALLMLSGIELISALLHPFPVGVEQTRESMTQHVANYPAWVLFLLGGLGWALTLLACCYLATRYGAGRHPAHGYGLGILMLAAAAFNIWMLPYPAWYVLLAIVLLPTGMVLGVRLAR